MFIEKLVEEAHNPPALRVTELINESNVETNLKRDCLTQQDQFFYQILLQVLLSIYNVSMFDRPCGFSRHQWAIIP